MTDNELANLKDDSDACGPVTHAEAWDHLTRFTHKAFGRSGNMPVLTIPADPKRDSDLRLGAYIHQNMRRERLLREAAAALGVADSIDIADCNVLVHQIEALKANQRFESVPAEVTIIAVTPSCCRSQLYKIGELVRYGDGPTAIMRIESVHLNHGGFGVIRYYGQHCMGGSVGAFQDDCVSPSKADIVQWETCKERRVFTESNT